MSESNVTFLGWNYKEGIVTRYKRNGECNGCGDCCRKLIFVQPPNDEIEETLSKHSGESEADFHSEHMEPEFDNPDRHLWRFDVTDQDHTCAMLQALEGGKGSCKIQSEKPAQCTIFPTHPNDIKNLPNCSYSFETVEQWTFEPTRDASE